jgi:SAM-dependent methyltransferase
MRATIAANLAVYSEPSIVAHYAALTDLTPGERFLFNTYIQPGVEVLDIGVGGGRTTPYLSSVASHYIGLDYSEQMVRTSRNKFPGLHFLVADASNLSQFSDSSFDVIVIAFNGLDHVAQRQQCLQECFRVLRPGGRLIFSSHNPRAIFVRPAWNRNRLHAFASGLAGGRSRWAELVAGLLTPLKAIHSCARAAKDSCLRCATRLGKPFFWRGQGQAVDAGHGGMMTHYWIPDRAIRELTQFGFELLTYIGSDFPADSHIMITDWYYYVFSRKQSCGSETKCA